VNGGGGGGGGGEVRNSTVGFIHTSAVTVCRGPYAPDLLAAWTTWDVVVDGHRKSENEVRPARTCSKHQSGRHVTQCTQETRVERPVC